VPLWGHAPDKQLAANAWVNDLTVVSQSGGDFSATGVCLKNAFVPV